MKVPNADQAIVAWEKIVGYLLNPTHPTGGPKSAFFRAFGFTTTTVTDWQVLAEALLQHVQANDIVDVRQTVEATSYSVIGPLMTPDGRNPSVLSAWYIRDGETVPRFATAFPKE